MNFLVKGVVKAHDYFIFDSWNDYIVVADSLDIATIKVSALATVKDGEITPLIDVEEIKPISEANAKALMSINRTKKINDSITQIILY